MIGSLLRRLLATISLALLAFQAAAPASAKSAARPALWAVSDSDTTIYLFGTIHLLPQGYQWRTPVLDRAVSGSQQLVVETIVDEKNPHQMMAAMAALAFSPNLPPVSERVPPDKREALAKAIAKSGMPPTALDRMETWAVAFTLLGNQFKDIGLRAGVEPALRSAFASQGKTVAELESNRDQLSFFDALPERAQRVLLTSAIEEPGDMSKEFERMLGAWARGDVDSIARTFNEDLASVPELRELLLKRRNANWSRWVRQRMASPGAVLLAVGAGHLAGRDSLIDMLQRDGFKVRRLQ